LTNQSLEKTKIGDSATKICALWSAKYAGLANGLSYKPWIEAGVPVVDKVTGKQLTWQDREEKRWNLPEGYLNNRSWKKGDSLKGSDQTYFQNTTWKLNDGSTVLDMDNFNDAMLYYVALDSKYIANSEMELKARKWPYATHYIALENEADEMKYAKNKRKIKALSILESDELNFPRAKSVCFILGLASSTADITEETATNLLYSFIEADNIDLNDNIGKFINLVSLLKDEKGREEFEARLLLKKGVDSRTIYEKSDSYVWNKSTGSIVIGDTYKEAVSFLINPKKQVLVQELENEIKSKIL